MDALQTNPEIKNAFYDPNLCFSDKEWTLLLLLHMQAASLHPVRGSSDVNPV